MFRYIKNGADCGEEMCASEMEQYNGIDIEFSDCKVFTFGKNCRQSLHFVRTRILMCPFVINSREAIAATCNLFSQRIDRHYIERACQISSNTNLYCHFLGRQTSTSLHRYSLVLNITLCNFVCACNVCKTTTYVVDTFTS